MNRAKDLSRYGRLALASGAFLIASSAFAHSATLQVANNGIDSSTCGGVAHPCRTINHALIRANVGDQIVVGPGHYGNPEENSPTGCGCLIEISKPVTIVSRDGASVTILDGGGQLVEVVKITADGVNVGKPTKGFSLVGGVIGLSIAPGVTGIDVVGNRSTSNKYGFQLQGTGHTFRSNGAVGNGALGFWIFGSGHQLTGNVAISNDEGYRVEVAAGPGIDLHGNAAIGNRNAGITVQADAIGVNIGKGNMFGNGGTLRNLGLVNYTTAPVDASHNFWGATTGPGANPADDIYDETGSVKSTPFTKKEFNVKGP